MEEGSQNFKAVRDPYNQFDALRRNERDYFAKIIKKWEFLEPDPPHRMANICNLLIGINSTLHYIEKDLDEKIKMVNSTVSFIEKQLEEKAKAKKKTEEENTVAAKEAETKKTEMEECQAGGERVILLNWRTMEQDNLEERKRKCTCNKC